MIKNLKCSFSLVLTSYYIYFIYGIIINYGNICNYMLGQSHPNPWGDFGPKLICSILFVNSKVEGAVTDA